MGGIQSLASTGSQVQRFATITAKPSDKVDFLSRELTSCDAVLEFYAVRSASPAVTALRTVFKEVQLGWTFFARTCSRASAKPPCTSGPDIASAQAIIFDALIDARCVKKSSCKTSPLSPARVMCLHIQGPASCLAATPVLDFDSFHALMAGTIFNFFSLSSAPCSISSFADAVPKWLHKQAVPCSWRPALK